MPQYQTDPRSYPWFGMNPQDPETQRLWNEYWGVGQPQAAAPVPAPFAPPPPINYGLDPGAIPQPYLNFEELLTPFISPQESIYDAPAVQPLQGMTEMINSFFGGFGPEQQREIPRAPKKPRFLDPQPPLPSTATGPPVI